MDFGCAPATSGKASAVAAAPAWATKRRRAGDGARFIGGLLRGSVELRGRLAADPYLGVDVADAGQLHLVLVTIGAVQAVQPLHGPPVFVLDQAAHRQQ